MAVEEKDIRSELEASADALLAALQPGNLTAGAARMALQTMPGQHSSLESFLLELDEDEPISAERDMLVEEALVSLDDFNNQFDPIENEAIGFGDAPEETATIAPEPEGSAPPQFDDAPPIDAYGDDPGMGDPMSEYDAMTADMSFEPPPTEDQAGPGESAPDGAAQDAPTTAAPGDTGAVEQHKMMTAEEFEQMWDASLRELNENFALNRHEHRHIKTILLRIYNGYLREGVDEVPVTVLQDLLEGANYTYKSSHPLRQILDYHLEIAGDNNEYTIPVSHFGPKWMEFYTREIARHLTGNKPTVTGDDDAPKAPGEASGEVKRDGAGGADQPTRGDRERGDMPPPPPSQPGHVMQGGFMNIGIGGGSKGDGDGLIKRGASKIWNASASAVKASAATTNSVVTKLSEVRAERAVAAAARQDLQVKAVDNLSEAVTKLQNNYARFQSAKVREREPEGIKLKKAVLKAQAAVEGLTNPKLAKSMPAGLKDRMQVQLKALDKTAAMMSHDGNLAKTKIGKSISELVSKLGDLISAIGRLFKLQPKAGSELSADEPQGRAGFGAGPRPG